MTMPPLAPSSPRHPKRWLLLPVTINVYLPFSAVDDASFTYTDTTTGIAYPDVNYFVLKGNTLSMSAEQGVLKNDAAIEFVPYLTAVQQGDGQYGTFAIAASGAFTYTPYSWVFDSPLFTYMGLEDTCQYAAMDPTGHTSGSATVTVDLVELYIMRNGSDVDQNAALLDVWVGEKITVSVGSRGEFPAVPGIATFQWTVASKAVDGYTGYGVALDGEGSEDPDGPGDAKVLPLTADELDNASIDFYWVEGGGRGLSVTATAIGQTASDSASFYVNHPCVEVTVDSSGLRIIEVENGNDIVELSGTNADGTFKPGIELQEVETLWLKQLVSLGGHRLSQRTTTLGHRMEVI